MAQYKHSRLGSLKLSGLDNHNRTFGGTMVTFIFALLLMLVIAGIFTISVTFTSDSPEEVSEDGAIILSDDLANGGIYSDHINGGWTFVPNLTPDTVKWTLNNASGHTTK